MSSEKIDIPISLDMSAVSSALNTLRQMQAPVDVVGDRIATATNTMSQLNDRTTVIHTGWQSWRETVSETVDSIALMNSTVSRSSSVAAIDRLNNRTRQLRTLATQAGDQFARIGQSKAPELPSSSTAGPGLGTVIQVGAVAAQVGAISKINRSMTAVRKTVADTTSAFDTFRFAKTAPPVDPGFNVLESAVKKTAGVVSDGIDNVRKAADASLDGWKDTASATAAGAQKISKSLGDVATTSAKYNWHTKAGIGSLRIMKNLFLPLRGTLQGYEDKLRKTSVATDKVATNTANMSLTAAAASAKLAGAAYVVTGSFNRGEGAAAMYAGSLKWMLFPARMLFREFEGGKRVVNALMYTVSAITSPVRLVSNAFRKTAQESALLNQSLKGKSRTTKVLAKSWFALYQATKPVVGAFRGAYKGTRLLVGGLRRVAGPTVAVTRNVGRAVKNLLMFGRTSVKAGSDAARLAASTGPVKAGMIGIANASKRASSSIARVAKSPGGMLKGIVSSRLAMGALAAAAIAWGGASAIATETATVKFGTLLQDMGQGKALIKEITSFSAATPFSNAALRESAALLLNAKIPADQITAKMTELGDIAAGTSTPIAEIAGIYQKMATKPKLGLDDLNQMASRGIPIFDELQQVTGKSRAELFKMISDGKIGLPQVDAALQNLTTNGGKFSGGMAAQSQTMAGLWSTLKDNVGIALEGIVGVFLNAAKPIMASAITTIQFITSKIELLQPVFNGLFGFVKSMLLGVFSVAQNVFGMIYSVAISALSMIGIDGAGTFDDIIVGLVTFYAMAQYSFENFGLLAAIAFDTTLLAFVGMGNDFAHFFGTVLPAYFNWFSQNWSLMFLDAAAMVGTFAENIKNNIVNAWTAIWDYITGKSDALTFDWTPLTDGFRKTMADLPDIPPRAMSQLELQMTADLNGMKSQFGDGMAAAVATALETLKPVETEALKATQGIDSARGVEDVDAESTTSSKPSRVVDSLERGSAESLKAIYNSQQDKAGEKQLKETQKQTKHLAAIAAKPAVTFNVAGGV